MKRPVRIRTQGVVGAEGEKPSATRFKCFIWYDALFSLRKI